MPTATQTREFRDCVLNSRAVSLVDNDQALGLHQHIADRPATALDKVANNVCPYRAIFACSISFHFGHNLMNETGRMWALLDSNLMQNIDAIVVAVQFPGSVFEILTPEQWCRLETRHHPVILWMLTLLSALPIATSKSVILTSGQTRFNSLLLPTRVLHAGWHPDMVNFEAMQSVYHAIRDSISNPLPAVRPRVYISRRQFDDQTRAQLVKNPASKHVNLRICENEQAFEEELVKRGFVVHTFENLSSKDQIKIAGQSSVLMSLGGSGLHHSCFCQREGHLISLGDFRWVNAEGEPNGNQSLMNRMVPGLKCSFIKMRVTSSDDIFYSLDLPYTLAQIDKIL